MSEPKRLGDILIQKGLATQSQVDEAIRIQVGGNRRLGYIMIKMGLISDDQLLEVLSSQLAAPIIVVDNEFSKDVARVLPRYLCRKYTVIPLSKGNNNILNLAMVDPSDESAITDIEIFTGMVVKPMLAREKDVSSAIGRYLSFSIKDIFNPQIFDMAAKIASTATLVLLFIVGIVSYNHIQAEKYGETSISGDSTTYKNHDLMVGVERNGRLSLLGHGAYSKGYYSVTFQSPEGLISFIDQKRKNFSEKQFKWLVWVVQNKITQGAKN